MTVLFGPPIKKATERAVPHSRGSTSPVVLLRQTVMMPNQHFLPASYIGRFSLETSGRWRKRTVWVQRVGREPYSASAEYVGHAQRIYDREQPSDWGGATIDSGWKYEGRLPEAITALDSRSAPLDGHLWAEVLVPFVSSLFIRGLDFASRYESRTPGLTGPAADESTEPLFDSWHDNTIAGRQIEWQRILAAVMSSQWTVVHGSGAPVLITNDVAHCLMTKHGDPSDEVSYAFPLTPSSVLVLERRMTRRILDWDGDRWFAPIEHRETTDDDLLNCRRALQDCAWREVYGPSRLAVAFPTSDFQPSTAALGPGYLIPHPRSRALLAYIEDYFKVLTLLQFSPMEYYGKAEKIDWRVVARSWAGTIQVIVNMPRFPGGLALTPFAVYLDLSRFTIDDVQASLGKKGEEMPPVSTEPRPGLLALMQDDLRTVGIETGRHAAEAE